MVGVKFSFKLKDRMVFVDGDSGTGKTVLFNAIMQYAGLTDAPIILINYNMTSGKIDNVRKHLVGNENKLIVIDNADTILDAEMRGIIALDYNNQYLIFGRDVQGLGVRDKSMAYIEIVNNKGKLKYEFV